MSGFLLLWFIFMPLSVYIYVRLQMMGQVKIEDFRTIDWMMGLLSIFAPLIFIAISVIVFLSIIERENS